MKTKLGVTLAANIGSGAVKKKPNVSVNVLLEFPAINSFYEFKLVLRYHAETFMLAPVINYCLKYLGNIAHKNSF